ncbi:cytochrome P450 [Mycena polygramma]|nr:cytochrome P450 [Mycena polygramma]
MHLSLLLPVIIGGVTVIYFFLRRQKRPRPPGPPALPLIGNLLQVPKDHAWKTYAAWAEKYGDVVYLEALGQPIVILGSLTAAHDLLNQRSAIYSSRPRLVMAGELVGFDQAVSIMPYTPRFLALRRLIHKEMSANVLRKYWPSHEEQSRILVENVLLDPDHFLDHIRHYSGSSILRTIYGYQTAPRDDEFLILAEKVMESFSLAVQPGAWAVDIFPWLRHLPSWLPGMGFKKKAAIWYQLDEDLVARPFQWNLDHQDSSQLIQPNFVSTIYGQWNEPSEDDKHLLAWAAAGLFGGGADTTVSALSTFFLAMALHPEIQATAQVEIDKVLTDTRLPQLSDRPSLPYVECLMWEVLRWKPLVPLGLPHLLTKDDIYRDYHIPSGSIVMVNIWSILRDPVVFPNPEEFQPARFLNDTRALEVTRSIFGFGRRVCPGTHFADDSMFIAIATTLSQCRISDPLDVDGAQVSKGAEPQPGGIRHPKKFTCLITARAGESSVRGGRY